MTKTFLLHIADALAAIACATGLPPTHAGMARNPFIDVAAVITPSPSFAPVRPHSAQKSTPTVSVYKPHRISGAGFASARRDNVNKKERAS